MRAPAGTGGLRAAFALHLHGLERAEGAGASPPCDLLRVRDAAGDGLRLVFAVAGFRPDQLEIRVVGDQLSVGGENTGDGDPGRFLHRGVAVRRFRRAFRLAPRLDVVAVVDRGLLSIALAPGGGARLDRTVAIRPRSP